MITISFSDFPTNMILLDIFMSLKFTVSIKTKFSFLQT